MNEREAFLEAIAANPYDDLIRLVFADWLDEHGEPEEAERQRKWPEAKKRLDEICTKHNAACGEQQKFTYDELLEFGRNASAIPNMQIEVSEALPDSYFIVSAIRDHIPEFWRAWSVITGSPLKPEVEQKYYYSSGYCCSTDISPDTHLAGPIPEEIRRAEEERVRYEQQYEEEEERHRQLQQQQIEYAEQERRQQVFDMLQDDLEKE